MNRPIENSAVLNPSDPPDPTHIPAGPGTDPALNLGSISGRSILDALPDGAYVTDRDRRIVFWSRAAEALTGWTAAEVLGHSCADNILVHVDKDGHQLCGQEHCPLHRAIVTDTQSTVPVLVFAQHKQGHRVPVEVSVAPLRTSDGSVVGGIEIFRDMSQMLQDLNRAKSIQDRALDSVLPADERVKFEVYYQPQELVGGDFYRLERLNAHSYLLLIADVMGHGVASALYTMQLRSILEECRHSLVSPELFVTDLNERLHTLASPNGYFATAFCAVINVVSGRLCYVRAGHPAPFLFRAGGGVERLDAKSPAIGLREKVLFEQSEVHLRAGDRLLCFTDGAVEIPCGHQDLGEDGLLRIVQEQSGLDLRRIERQLLEMSSLIRLPDDLTLISMWINPGQADGKRT